MRKIILSVILITLSTVANTIANASDSSTLQKKRSFQFKLVSTSLADQYELKVCERDTSAGKIEVPAGCNPFGGNKEGCEPQSELKSELVCTSPFVRPLIININNSDVSNTGQALQQTILEQINLFESIHLNTRLAGSIAKTAPLNSIKGIKSGHPIYVLLGAAGLGISIGLNPVLELFDQTVINTKLSLDIRKDQQIRKIYYQNLVRYAPNLIESDLSTDTLPDQDFKNLFITLFSIYGFNVADLQITKNWEIYSYESIEYALNYHIYKLCEPNCYSLPNSVWATAKSDYNNYKAKNN